RKPRKEPTPLGEDQGLFRSCPVDISLTLLPFSKKSSRGFRRYMCALLVHDHRAFTAETLTEDLL
ncbi:MAG: hypothetical protein AAFY31_08740, partial [Pseudomonadota bacterium]